VTERDVDVVVVGSGAAGLTAALEARAAGADRVLVAEAEGVVGGSSRLSGGLMMGAGTRYQRALGIEDSPAALFRDYLQLNRWNVDAGPVRAMTDGAGAAIEWLGDMGVEFYPDLVYGGDEPVPRVHVPIGRGQGIVDVLHRACREAGVDIALGRRVDRLLLDNGAVRGVAVGADAITAGAVVVATGGFGNAPDLLERHYPSAAGTSWAWYIGADGSRGDALSLAEQVDAQLLGRDRGLRLLHAGFDHIYEAYLPGWVLLVDADGHRFADETAPYGIMDHLVRMHGNRVFAIFDRRTLDDATSAGVARYKQTIPGSTKKQSPHFNADVVDQMVRKGKVATAGTIAELATAIGVPASHLGGTVERYNRGVRGGIDTDHEKAAKFLEPVETGPFYAVELRPATVCFTAFGLRIDARARVLGNDGAPIPGLLAAGECTGGVVGEQYVGSGNSYANCVTIGRIAGTTAASHAAGHEAFA
jgi:flavocytochrome c